MALPLIYYGRPVLEEKGSSVTEFNEELKVFADELVDTVLHNEAFGLAAQHIGKPLQVCAINITEQYAQDCSECLLDEKALPLRLIMPLVIVNPYILEQESALETQDEASASFPGIQFYSIERPEVIKIAYQDIEGHQHTLECQGIVARCIQHEMDQANGIVARCIQHEMDQANGISPFKRMHPLNLNKIKSKLKQLKRASKF